MEAIPQAAGWRLRFAGIDDPETAKLYGGNWICVPAEKAKRPEGGWIEADLVGLPVVDEDDAVLGTCKGLADLPTLSIAVTGADGKEIIFPMEGPLAPVVDLEAKRIRADRETWDALS